MEHESKILSNVIVTLFHIITMNEPEALNLHKGPTNKCRSTKKNTPKIVILLCHIVIFTPKLLMHGFSFWSISELLNLL